MGNKYIEHQPDEGLLTNTCFSRGFNERELRRILDTAAEVTGQPVIGKSALKKLAAYQTEWQQIFDEVIVPHTRLSAKRDYYARTRADSAAGSTPSGPDLGATVADYLEKQLAGKRRCAEIAKKTYTEILAPVVAVMVDALPKIIKHIESDERQFAESRGNPFVASPLLVMLKQRGDAWVGQRWSAPYPESWPCPRDMAYGIYQII